MAERPAKSVVAPLQLQSHGTLVDAESYSLTSLLQYHDKVFVENVYKALSGCKASDEEINQTLDDLRSGRFSKTEIIESIADRHKNADRRVIGLPSRLLRTVSGWPFVGYILRIIRGVTKLPVIMQDQQRFEAYALGQQQQIADYVNENLLPLATRPTFMSLDGSGNSSIADAVESVIMLSDSLLELSEKQELIGGRIESLTVGVQTLQTQIQTVAGEMQAQQQQSELQLHANLVELTERTQALQQLVGSLQNEVNENITAQREFLVQEQNLIVVAQKLAFKNLEERLSKVQDRQGAELQALSAAMEKLQTRVGRSSSLDSP